jgi:endonuclease YncB( thermonuclease family)
LTVVGENAAGDWYELDNGAWIAAFLVKPAPDQESGPPEGSQAAKVTKVVDGDTIDVSINGETYRVRYILINTPERDQLFYAEATAANRHLVMGKTVYLVKDVNETDRYGRLLRYIYLEDGTFVNRELVRQGFAQLATFPPDVAKEAEIRAAQQEAINAGRGPPQEMQRLDGRLYARYMMQFFVLEGEQMVQHGGMFPNRSLTPGTVRVEWESENLPS